MSIPHRHPPEARLRPAAPGQNRTPPTVPLLLMPGSSAAFKFADINALAEDIQERRRLQLGKPGLRLRRLNIGWGGYRTFPGFACYWLFGDDETYAFTVAANGCAQETLEAAIRRAEPTPVPRRLGDEAPRPDDLLVIGPLDEAA